MSNSLASWLEISPWPAQTRGFFDRIFNHLSDHLLPHERNSYNPHLLSERALGLLAVLLCVVKVVAISASIIGPINFANSASITVSNIVNLTNQARKQTGMGELQTNNLLNIAAQGKAEDMLQNSYFAHTSPKGVSPWDWFNKAGYVYKAAGENLAVNFTDDKAVVDAWLKSPGHRANLLNDTFAEIGIGIATGPFEGHLATFVVQMFGLPIVTTAKPKTVHVQPKQAVKPANTAMADESVGKSTGGAVNLEEQIITLDHKVTLKEGSLNIEARFNGQMQSVKARFGSEVMDLTNVGENIWDGKLAVAGDASGAVIIDAISKSGREISEKIAQVENSTSSAFGLPSVTRENIAQSSPAWERLQNSERTVYPLLIATILVVMIISMLMRKHVHHVKMIANASFVVILASLLWMI